jgi:hypothetical protein
MRFPKQKPDKITSQNPIIFNELTITDLRRKVKVKLSEESTSDEAISFDIIPYKHLNYLVSRYDRPRESMSPSSVSSAADQVWLNRKPTGSNFDFRMELSAMHWTDYISEFKQTMFKFDNDELREADRLHQVVSKIVVDRNSSSPTALAAFVLLLGDYIASNVEGDRWDEALDAIGLLVIAALARVGSASITPSQVSSTTPQDRPVPTAAPSNASLG